MFVLALCDERAYPSACLCYGGVGFCCYKTGMGIEIRMKSDRGGKNLLLTYDVRSINYCYLFLDETNTHGHILRVQLSSSVVRKDHMMI